MEDSSGHSEVERDLGRCLAAFDESAGVANLAVGDDPRTTAQILASRATFSGQVDDTLSLDFMFHLPERRHDPSVPVADGDWRTVLAGQLGEHRPSNQARAERLRAGNPVEDELAFANMAELTVYRALKQLQQLRRATRDQPRKASGRGSAGAAGRTDGRPSAPGIAPVAPQRLLYLRWPTSGTYPAAQMSTGDERLDAVEDRIDEAKEAADPVRTTRAWACATARRTRTAPSSPRRRLERGGEPEETVGASNPRGVPSACARMARSGLLPTLPSVRHWASPPERAGI